MLRDESIYPDASTFNPERFIEADPEKKKLMDPRNYIFGFGRRWFKIWALLFVSNLSL